MTTGYLHAIDPFAIKFSEDFGIRWYGVSYLLGFLAVYLIIYWLAKRGLTQIKPGQVSDFVFVAALGTIIGGRLGYCIFYSPELLNSFSPNFPFWGLLAVHRGGMASHGGVIGIIIACAYFARKNKISILHCMDLCALCSGPGIFFGRIANFINGELVGRQAPLWLKWGVRFPQDILSWPSHERERLLTLAPVVENLGASKEYWRHAVENLPNSHSAQVFINSMLSQIIEAVRHSNLTVIDALASVLTLRHPSQIYEALLEGLFLFLLLLFIWRKARKPGIISGFFLISYSIVRIFCEEFRMPDLQIGFQLFGLTRGQWLSIAMISFGFICMIYWAKRPVETVGGWLNSH